MFKVGDLQAAVVDESLVVLGESATHAVEAHRDCRIVGDCLIV